MITSIEKRRYKRQQIREMMAEQRAQEEAQPEAQKGYLYDNGKIGDQRRQIILPFLPSLKAGTTVTLEMMPVFVGLVTWPWVLLLCWHLFREVMGWPTFTVLNPDFDMMVVRFFGG